MSVIGRIERDPDAAPARTGSPRMQRGCDLIKFWSQSSSIRDLHKRISEVVKARGRRWGLLRGSRRCPVKDGYLRHYWMVGCHEGIAARTEARKTDDDRKREKTDAILFAQRFQTREWNT